MPETLSPSPVTASLANANNTFALASCAQDSYILLPWSEPTNVKDVYTLVAICKECPVQASCFERAESLRIQGSLVLGVWAGRLYHGRKEVREKLEGIGIVVKQAKSQGSRPGPLSS